MNLIAITITDRIGALITLATFFAFLAIRGLLNQHRERARWRRMKERARLANPLPSTAPPTKPGNSREDKEAEAGNPSQGQTDGKDGEAV